MNENIRIKEHSLLKSSILHTLPGLFTTGAFILLKTLTDKIGCPPLLAFLLAILFVDIPIIIAIILFEGININGKFSLKNIIGNNNKINLKTFILIFIGTFAVVFILITLITPINDIITEKIFNKLPKWMFLNDPTQYKAYSKFILIAIFSFQFILTGIILPFVEELYFRGFLLPRISRFGVWSVLWSGVLFAIYHCWQLYSFPILFVLGISLGLVVWWKKDLRLSIALHVTANAVTRLWILISIIMI